MTQQSELRWQFDPFAWKVEGPNDPAMSHFSASRTSSLYRECLQNSIDARADDTKTVEVAIEKVNLPVDSFAGGELAHHFKAAANCRHLDTSEYKDVFEEVAHTLRQSKIVALRITDSGTTGTKATGDYQWETPWLSLMGTGVSPKSGIEIGKWGIGKYAAPAATRLRTALYATYYQDGNGKGFRLLGGRTRLTSHEIDEDQYQAEGYLTCDSESNNAMVIMENGPATFVPQQGSPFWLQDPGTAVFVPGFDFDQDGKSWRQELKSQVIVNFFYALLKDHLSVIALGDSEDEQFTIDSLEIDQLIAESMNDKDSDSSESRTVRYISACRKPELSTHISGIGEVHLHLDVPERSVDYDSRIALVRHPGMLITDDGKQMGIPGLQRLRGRFRPFTAVLVCISGKKDNVIRSCENPSHNALSTDNIRNQSERLMAVKALKKLGDWVKNNLPRYEPGEVTERLQLSDELVIMKPGQTLKRLWVGEPRKSDQAPAARRHQVGSRSELDGASDEAEPYDTSSDLDTEPDESPNPDTDSVDPDPVDSDPVSDTKPNTLPGEKDNPNPRHGTGVDLKPIFKSVYGADGNIETHKIQVSFRPPPEDSKTEVELQCVSEDSSRFRMRVNAVHMLDVRSGLIIQDRNSKERFSAVNGWLVIPTQLLGTPDWVTVELQVSEPVIGLSLALDIVQ